MIIRYCLSLAAKLSAADDKIRYDENTGTGFLIFPSRHRLRDYKNYIKPERGFNPNIMHELRHKVKDFWDKKKKICSSITGWDEYASHVLVFLIRSIAI